MEMEHFDDAIRSIPHIGPILATVLAIARAIQEEIKSLPERYDTIRRLGKEAKGVLSDIAVYSRNLKARDEAHEQALKEKAEDLKKVAQAIQRHVWEITSKRNRRAHHLGEKFADIIESVKPTEVWKLKMQLQEAKENLINEVLYVRTMEGDGTENDLPPYSSEADTDTKCEIETIESVEYARWVRKAILDKKRELRDMMVPICSQEATEDGVVWYIARVSHIGGHQPGKYKLGDDVAYFGFKREVYPSSEFEVLIADPKNIRWQAMSGRFSEEHLGQARLVQGCHEGDDTVLAIVRARAREHMHLEPWKEKFLHPGKASANLDGAFVIAGEKEAHVRGSYQILVYS